MSDDRGSPLARSATLQKRLLFLVAIVAAPLLLLAALAIGQPDSLPWALDATAAPLRAALAWSLAIGAAVAVAGVAAILVLARRLSRALDEWTAAERREATVAMQRFAFDLERKSEQRAQALAKPLQQRQADVAAARQTELDSQLGRARRLEAIGQLTGGIAHDFNDLLTVIVGHLDRLVEIAEPEGERAELAQAALKAALRGSELTRGMLAFARQQALSPRPINLNSRLATMLPVLQRMAGPAVRIEPSFEMDPWIADADAAQVEAALVNLVLNARDAMPQGGTLSIATGNARLGTDYTDRNAGVIPGDYVMLAVTDTGVGMAPEAVDAAFDPLFTTKADGHNTGLGLSMVYGFAQQSRGHAKITSEVGHGTTVRLYLPRSASTTADERGRDSFPPVMRTGRESVLLVEDNADVRSLSLRHLTELGYRVHAAETGAAAAAALEGPEPFDLLFTDIVMPGGMTGYGVADIAVVRRPGIKVLFATGYAGPGTAHGQQRHPDAPMLSKPFRKQELAEAVRTALDAR